MRRRIVTLVGLTAGAGLAAALWLASGRGPATGSSPAAAPEASAAVQAPATGELRVASGDTIVIEAGSLEPGRPVVLWLALGEPSQTDEPRPVRILAADGSRSFEGQGRLGAERREARFEVDPDFLSPGRYIVEVKTTELTHFPLRRYVVEVR